MLHLLLGTGLLRRSSQFLCAVSSPDAYTQLTERVCMPFEPHEVEHWKKEKQCFIAIDVTSIFMRNQKSKSEKIVKSRIIESNNTI